MQQQLEDENGESFLEENSAAVATSFISEAAEGKSADADELIPWPPDSLGGFWGPRSGDQIVEDSFELQYLQQQPFLWKKDQLMILGINEEAIDDALMGGIHSGVLTELAGTAGSGKTQLAFTLAAETLMQMLISSWSYMIATDKSEQIFCNGSDNVEELCQHTHTAGNNNSRFQKHELKLDGVIYFLFTEGSFPVERLKEILLNRLRSRIENDRRFAAAACAAAGNIFKNIYHLSEKEWNLWVKQIGCEAVANKCCQRLLSQVYVQEVGCEKELISCLLYKLPRLAASLKTSEFPFEHDFSGIEHDSNGNNYVNDSDNFSFNSQRNGNLYLGSPLSRVLLLVIDSLAAVLKHTDPSPYAAMQRNIKVQRIGYFLRKFAGQAKCSCLVLNHVSGVVDENNNLRNDMVDSYTSNVHDNLSENTFRPLNTPQFVLSDDLICQAFECLNTDDMNKQNGESHTDWGKKDRIEPEFKRRKACANQQENIKIINNVNIECNGNEVCNSNSDFGIESFYKNNMNNVWYGYMCPTNVKPALGSVWKNSVTCRIMLSKLNPIPVGVQVGQTYSSFKHPPTYANAYTVPPPPNEYLGPGTRWLHITASPFGPICCVPYVITAKGVVGSASNP